MTPQTLLRLLAGASVTDLQRAAGVHLDGAFAEWRGSLDEAALLLERLAKGNALTAQELLADFPTERHPVLLMSLAWLAKLGIVDWLASEMLACMAKLYLKDRPKTGPDEEAPPPTSPGSAAPASAKKP